MTCSKGPWLESDWGRCGYMVRLTPWILCFKESIIFKCLSTTKGISFTSIVLCGRNLVKKNVELCSW